MMERRRALTIPFTVDKDNLMESPFRIPMTCFSSQCGKFERQQVSWTEIACKRRHRDSQHKNGSVLCDHNHAAMVTLEMARRKPRLILTDILKTEKGKAYMERIKQNCTLGNQQVSSTRRKTGRGREEPLICRDKRSSQRETRNDKINNVTPKHNQKTTSSPSQRSRLRRRLNVDDEVDKEERDIEEVIIGKDHAEDYKFAEVVDCGLSVSWEPAEDRRSSNEFSPAAIKDRWTGSEKEVQNNLKRKRKDAGAQCNGTGSPKRHRESVLRLTGEDGRDGRPALTGFCLEESGEDGDLESLDRSIVQFTVGADDPTEVLVPNISPTLEARDFIVTPRQSQLSSQDSTTKRSPAEPIVLSSDDEESCDVPQHCSPALHTLVTVEEAVIQAQSPKAVAKQQEASHIEDMQVLHVVVEDPPLIPSVDYCVSVAFSALHCGGFQGKSNGDLMMAAKKIIIPLKDTSEQVRVILSIERKELRRYGVWELQDLEAQKLHFKTDQEPSPRAILLFCVSEKAAAAVQQDLLKLGVKQDGPTNTDRVSGLDLIHTPILSVGQCIELIRKSGRDSHLLFLFGLESTEPRLNTDQDGPHSDTDKNTTQKETILEPETATERDTGTPLKPEELEHPSEKKKEEPAPVHTVCHRRTKGSYSVSLCKPDSSWIKYKHQGLAHRLIQFPPPPLKGGITVTMEDLQCLDSGQFLNDVIIDFYLKYLLHKASAAVAERSHIFSSFFYKQLTRRDNASEGGTSDSCQRQRRHQRVKTWTRHVEIFKKDFLFVPVNQEAHWYLVVICFPGLDEPKSEDWNGPNSQTGELQDQVVAKSQNDNNETPPTVNHSDNVDTETGNGQEEPTKDPKPGPVTCTEQTYQKKTVCKRPCILVMDSLKRSLHERVFKLLRDYLESEWEVRRGSSRDFSPDQMQSSHCQVPLQDNSSDCGLYLLQYVESFLKDPVVHFDLPLQLERWFPRQQVRRKRDEIRDLVLNLYRHQNLDSNR
ncbi:sentrin-specific protease 7 isoform X5 [Dicentrarchus labrax]|uniref:sentrin-specific protease 7 isoform X5 n=1 Tax=Dicentrarchus labrax TaxID=13489 RepID=UPI0021F531D8|nr:sentrin-specific protease 7 isoform X5 [Dicentrarchus labrax]